MHPLMMPAVPVFRLREISVTTVNQTAISVSITKDLLARIDDRANALGLTRSRYLAVIAQIDIDKGGPLTIPT